MEEGSHDILQLSVLSSPTLLRGQMITLNACGMFGDYLSEREKVQQGSGLDGFTYFGSSLYADSSQEVLNDFVIPYRNQ